MGEAPGFYFDIGKQAKDVLYKDHIPRSTAHDHPQSSDWSFKVSCEDLAPGLKTGLRLMIPDSSKVEVQYLHKYGGVAGGIDLSLRPTLAFSSLLGGSLISVGSEVALNTASKLCAQCNLGLNFNSNILIGSLKLGEEGCSGPPQWTTQVSVPMSRVSSILKASCYHALSPLGNSAIAAELSHSFMDKTSSLTFGAQHQLFQTTMLKANASSHGQVGAIIQHEVLPTFFVTLAGEVEMKASERGAKVGLSVALRP